MLQLVGYRKLGMSGSYVMRVECLKVHKKEKTVVFDLSVHWSDEKKMNILRKYSEVFDFLQEMKRVYEKSAVIPELKACKWFESSILKAKKERKKTLEDFFQKVLNLPEHIARGKEVCEFFSWVDESESDYQVDTVVGSRPSDSEYEIVDREGDGYHTLSIKPKNISVFDRQPFDDSASTYWAVSEYSKRKSGEVDLKEGAAVSVLQRELSGWWFVHVEDTAEEGWAPASCLLPADRNNLDYGKISGPFGTFQALKDYVAGEPDEVSCRKGEKVEVIEATLDGWWEVKCKEKVGRVPATNLEPLSNEKKLRNSLYGIYKKYSPPPRRNSKVSVEELYGKVDKFRKVPPAKAVPKSSNSDEDPDYAEVEFDRKIPSTNYKPNEVVVKNPPIDKKPDNPIEDEDDDSSFYINAPEELRRAYINVELKTNQKPQKQEIRYYKVKNKVAPIVKHQGRPLLSAEIGDIVESYTEEADLVFAKIFRLASGAYPDPREGWIPRSHLEPYELEPDGSLVAEPKTIIKNEALHSSAKSTQPVRPLPSTTKPKPVVEANCKPTPPKPRTSEPKNNQIPNRSQLSCALPDRNTAGKAPGNNNFVEHSRRTASVGSAVELEAPPAPKKNSVPQAGIPKALPEDASSEVDKFTVRKLSRTECENVLLKSATQRQFIIRESTKVGHYALSVRSADRIHHFPIELTPEKKYFIGKYNFDSLQDVISYYKRNPVFELDDGTEITLDSSLET